VEDEVSTAEAIRLFSLRRKNTKARWENVYRLWQEGKTLAEIGTWIGKSESTARQLLKRSALERQKQPGFVWPVDAEGKKICDIPHPMPKGDQAYRWAHVRALPCPPRSLDKEAKPERAYCPVCRRVYPIPKTLMEVLT